MTKSKGLLIVLSAPSGTGKSTLIKLLRQKMPNLTFSISYTTRQPRPGEINGKDYFFVSLSEFLRLKEQGFFAEWAKVHNNYYGTPKESVLKSLEQGKDLLFDIDIQGAKQLKSSLNQGTYVFIFPPSLQELKKRLQKRGTDDPSVIALRLENAKKEIESASFFDYWIVNDDLEDATNKLQSIVIAEKLKPFYNPGLPQKILQPTT